MTSCYETILFDLDGTVADTIGLILASYRHALGELAVPVPDEAVLRSWIGRTLADTFADEYPGLEPDLIDAYTRWNIDNLARLIRPYPGVADLLAELPGLGARVGIVTSKRRSSASASLAAVGLDGAVDVLAAMEDTTAHKPAPDPLLFALQVLGADAGSAVYVGDASVDLLAADAAGIAGVGVTWGAGTPEQLAAVPNAGIATTPEELRALLVR